MYKKIINPKTGRKVSIYGKIGKKILNNYIKLIGGAAATDSDSDSDSDGDITEEQIQQEMFSLEVHEYRSGDWSNTDYLREIAIYNLNHLPDKNITRPTRIPYNRNVFLRRDYGDGRLFLTASPDGLIRKYAIFPGDIKYAETTIYNRIRPERIQEDEMRERIRRELNFEDEEFLENDGSGD